MGETENTTSTVSESEVVQTPKRGPGRPKGSKKVVETPVAETASSQAVDRKLRAVAEPTAEDLQRQTMRRLEREALAKTKGVSVAELEPLPEEIEENWRDAINTQQEVVDPVYAGLYHLKGGAVFLGPTERDVARPGTYVRLSAKDGKHVVDRQIGTWIKP